MNAIKKFYSYYKEFLYDSSVNIKDRTFMLFTVSEMAALLIFATVSIFLGENISSVFILLLGVLTGIVLLYVFAKKNMLKTAKIVLTLILVLGLRPVAFFTKGGIDNGTLIMFLLGGYYLVLVLDGKFRIFMCILDTVFLLACAIISYYNPQLLPEYSKESDFVFSLTQYVIALAVLTIQITFWTKILQKEARLAEEKSRELEELNKSQNRFFSSMSHEIRTPINTVLGLNEIILRQEDASEEIRKDASDIQGAGKMLLALINDILDISKIEAGKMDIVPVNYSVSAVLSEIVNMIWLKANEKGLKFSVDIDPGVPEMLFGDEVRIKQILINLLNNAVKYTSEGSVSLHMECEFPDAGHVLLKINVSDTGMGIKAEALPHLFDSFQRQDEEKNRYIEGTGLGLSIVKQLVELMDGEITVNSVYEQGTTFAVVLKQGISSDKRIGDISITNAGGLGTSDKFEHSFHAPTASVLIVDDNEMNLEVESKLLEGTEMKVDLSPSGLDALSKTLTKRYDVIFMDHLMPGMDGIECYEKIRSQKGGLNRDVPIVVLTANAGGENIELYNNTGFDGYLVKPVSGRQLEEMLVSKLPSEKVIGNSGTEMTGSSISTASGYAKKRPVVIATSSMSDLPANVIKELGISIIPYYVITDEGTFYDNIDIDSDELVQYMGDEHRFVSSDPPEEDLYVRFFSEELNKAHQIIYITLQTGSSVEFERTTHAAKSFENVSIVNSECLSSGTGLLAMIAARLAKQNYPVQRILQELEAAKSMINCSFIIKSTDIMTRRKHISPFLNSVLDTLWLRPVLRTKNDKLSVGRFFLGSEKQCYQKYMLNEFKKSQVDKSFVFVTYVGMAEEDLLWIEETVKQKGGFERVVFQKASAGIASNCGGGTFGLIYLNKGERDYNLKTLFDDDFETVPYDGDFEEEEIIEAEETVMRNEPEAEQSPPELKENKWYESIDGMVAADAIKYCGSEEAFLSALKIYFDSYEAKAGELQGYYDSGDWENYTIKVHALKSSSRLVGLPVIGNEAEALEMAGKASDVDYIHANHDDLMKKYQSIRDALAPMLGVKDERPDIPPDMLEDAYGGLLEFAECTDYELARMVLDSVKEYKLPDEDEERFARLKDCLSRMDWDEIKKILHEKI